MGHYCLTYLGIGAVSQWTSTTSWTGRMFYIQKVVKLYVLRISDSTVSESMIEIAKEGREKRKLIELSTHEIMRKLKKENINTYFVIHVKTKL